MIEETKRVMSNLKFYGMLETLDLRLTEASEHGWGHTEMLSSLMTDEKLYRQLKSTERKIKMARFRTDATFERFDHTFKRSLTKIQLKDLMSLNFLRSDQNLLLLGPTGVGKTFLSTAIGHQACSEGFTCQFMGMNLFIEKINMSRAEGTFLKFRDRLIKCDLLILDDIGIRRLSAESIQDLYDILEERYQNKSTVITSQLPLSNWKEVIEDEVALEAIVDRIRYGIKLEIKGDSYRKKIEKRNKVDN